RECCTSHCGPSPPDCPSSRSRQHDSCRTWTASRTGIGPHPPEHEPAPSAPPPPPKPKPRQRYGAHGTPYCRANRYALPLHPSQADGLHAGRPPRVVVEVRRMAGDLEHASPRQGHHVRGSEIAGRRNDRRIRLDPLHMPRQVRLTRRPDPPREHQHLVLRRGAGHLVSEWVGDHATRTDPSDLLRQREHRHSGRSEFIGTDTIDDRNPDSIAFNWAVSHTDPDDDAAENL